MVRIKEDIFFFEGSQKRMLLGFMHRPTRQSRKIGILYCHPFADEQNLSHRIAVNTSRSLVSEGFTVFRFDMSGCGDSMAELDEVSIHDWIEDISCALQILKNEGNLKYLIIWGIRLGAGLAIIKASQTRDISALVLMNPIIDFNEYINQFFRRRMLIGSYDKLERKKTSSYVDEINENGKIDILGYTISKKFYDDMIKMGDYPSKILPKCKILLLTLSLMDNTTMKIFRYYEYQKTNKSMINLEHIKAETFWDRYWRWECKEIADVTINWLIASIK